MINQRTVRDRLTDCNVVARPRRSAMQRPCALQQALYQPVINVWPEQKATVSYCYKPLPPLKKRQAVSLLTDRSTFLSTMDSVIFYQPPAPAAVRPSTRAFGEASQVLPIDAINQRPPSPAQRNHWDETLEACGELNAADMEEQHFSQSQGMPSFLHTMVAASGKCK